MKNKNKITRIMLFGTFDGLHLGHLNLFKQARNLSTNSFLIASIARDKNVFRIKSKLPNLNEKQRLNLVKKCKLIDRVVLGSVNKYLEHIIKENPDIIALGYDQKAYVNELKSELKAKNINIKIKRLKPYKEKIYKNSLLKNKIQK
jgi:FAD synthetase